MWTVRRRFIESVTLSKTLSMAVENEFLLFFSKLKNEENARNSFPFVIECGQTSPRQKMAFVNSFVFYFQLALFKSGTPYLALAQDHAFFATMYNFAERYNIKWILN